MAINFLQPKTMDFLTIIIQQMQYYYGHKLCVFNVTVVMAYQEIIKNVKLVLQDVFFVNSRTMVAA
jgi:hypothetical protein